MADNTPSPTSDESTGENNLHVNIKTKKSILENNGMTMSISLKQLTASKSNLAKAGSKSNLSPRKMDPSSVVRSSNLKERAGSERNLSESVKSLQLQENGTGNRPKAIKEKSKLSSTLSSSSRNLDHGGHQLWKSAASYTTQRRSSKSINSSQRIVSKKSEEEVDVDNLPDSGQDLSGVYIPQGDGKSKVKANHIDIKLLKKGLVP